MAVDKSIGARKVFGTLILAVIEANPAHRARSLSGREPRYDLCRVHADFGR